MKVLIDRKPFAQAFGLVAPIAPRATPKPILRNVLFRASEDGSSLIATDLEVGVQVGVLGVRVDRPGRVVLPTDKVGQILKSCPDETLAIEADDGKVRIAGARAKFDLASEDPDLFPEAEDEPLRDYHSATAGDFRRAIRRTVYAVDPASTRYALGGVHLERDGGTLSFVATDGRRLSKQDVPCESEGDPQWPTEGAGSVVPAKALKLLERLLANEEPGQPIHFAFRPPGVVVAIPGQATIRSRLVEGRFPRYRDVLPGQCDATAEIAAADWLSAIQQASVATSDESRGVDFAFRAGTVRLTARAADVGESGVEAPILYRGEPVELTLDHRYATEPFAAFDPAATVRIELVDDKTAFVFRLDDGFVGCVMPLTRER